MEFDAITLRKKVAGSINETWSTSYTTCHLVHQGSYSTIVNLAAIQNWYQRCIGDK